MGTGWLSLRKGYPHSRVMSRLLVTLVEMSHVTVGADSKHLPGMMGSGKTHMLPNVQDAEAQDGLTPLELLTVHDERPPKTPPNADRVAVTVPTTGRVNSSSLSTTPSKVAGLPFCSAPVDVTRPLLPKGLLMSLLRLLPPGSSDSSTLPQHVKFVALEMRTSFSL